MGDTVNLLQADGTTVSKMSVDALSTRDGAAAASGETATFVKAGWGAEDDLNSTSDARPFPTREGKFTSVIQTTAGLNSSSSSQTLLAANTSCRKRYVSNGGASGIWLNFGATAVAGNGTYLPAKSKDEYPTDMQITFILESGGTAGPVSAIGV